MIWLLAKIGWGWATAGVFLAFLAGWFFAAAMSGGKKQEKIIEDEKARRN